MTGPPPAIAAAVVRAAPAGQDPLVLVRAPGRVNLLGEHTDYNGLPVLPMAIDRALYAAARPAPGGRVRARNLDPAFSPRTFAGAARIAPSPPGDWANYLKAAVQTLAGEAGGTGLALTVGSDLPAGAGLSSSAALVVATALALLATHGASGTDRLALAERLARAERYVGTLSGGMDQAVILLARAGAALRIDFFPLRVAPVALPPGHAVVVCDSLVRAEKAGGARAAYNRRVVECRLATRLLAAALGVELARLGDLRAAFPSTPLPAFVDALAERVPDAPLGLAAIARACDTTDRALAPLLTGAGLDPADAPTFRPLARARHVLTEAARVERAVVALAAGDAATFGELMAASHRSCRDDYDLGVPAVEALVAAAEDAGVTGTRMTGAGFGGCTVSLLPSDRVDDFLARVDRAFYRPRLPPATPPARHRFVLTPAGGAEVAMIAPAPRRPATRR
jgi:N-acetylgalactosamine kinase